MKTTRNLTFFSDPGHGWLSVSLQDLQTLNLVDKISPYSYMNATRAFLEEDLDAQLFLKAAKEAGWLINTKESNSEKSSPIRGYCNFSAQKMQFAQKLSVNLSIFLYNSHSKTHSTSAIITSLIKNKVFIKDQFDNTYKCSVNRLLQSTEMA